MIQRSYGTWLVKESTSATIGFLVAAAIPAAVLTASGLLLGPFEIENAIGLFVVLYVYSAIAINILGAAGILPAQALQTRSLVVRFGGGIFPGHTHFHYFAAARQS